jgi:hypothetical protein
MGEKNSNYMGEIFHSVCDECSDRLRLKERLPELLLAIVALRKQNGNKEHYQALASFASN